MNAIVAKNGLARHERWCLIGASQFGMSGMDTKFTLAPLLEGSESTQETISSNDLQRIRTILGPEFTDLDIVQLALVHLNNDLNDDDSIAPPESHWKRLAESIGQEEVNKLRGRDASSMQRLQSVLKALETRIDKP